MEDLSDILKRIASKNGSGDSGPRERPQDIDEPEVCGVCSGRSWLTTDVPAGDPNFGRFVLCECQEPRVDEERYSRLLRYSNLGALSRFTFETLRRPPSEGPDNESRYGEAYEAAESYAENPSGWIVFTGPYDPMKVRLAAAIGNRCLDRGYVVLFVHVSDLLDHLRATFSPTSEMAYSELFDQVRNTPLLILDDLGSHSTTPWAEEKLRQIVNQRYNAELPTVITTTGDLNEVDPYILSRIQSPDLSRIFGVGTEPKGPTHRLGGIDPDMLKRMTFTTFDVRGNGPSDGQRRSIEAARTAAKNFAADPDGWLTLFGETGVGKTHLAVAIAAEQLEKGKSIFFARVPELLDYLRYTFSPDSPVTYDRLFEDVKTAPLLILDDLGQEHSSPWASEKLYQIVVHRHDARLPTVVTSMVDFTKEHGPMGSRVQDTSVALVCRIDAPDYRNKAARRSGSPRQSGATRARPSR